MKMLRKILPVLLAILLLAAAGAETAPEAVVSTNYTFAFADADGAPVEGVVISVCGALFCAPAVSDADGIAVFEGEPCAYEVRILSVPAGYGFDPEQVFITEETYGRMDFILTEDSVALVDAEPEASDDAVGD